MNKDSQMKRASDDKWFHYIDSSGDIFKSETLIEIKSLDNEKDYVSWLGSNIYVSRVTSNTYELGVRNEWATSTSLKKR